MFRIEFLNLKGHPQLGDIDLQLSEPQEYKKGEKPYTSVIIGPNGTGKSFILRTIAEVFRQFKSYSVSNKKEFSLPYDIHLRYKYYRNTYEIVARKIKSSNNKMQRKEYLFFKNRPFNLEFNNDSLHELQTGFEVLHHELEYPDKLLVNSIIPTDRFKYQNSNPIDFYQYLGARSTSSTTSTKTSVRRTLKHIFNAAKASNEFRGNLKELLKFLEFEDCFKVEYKTKINKLFFSKSLTIDNFKKYFENWWDEDFEYTKRKQENPLWSIPYYNQYFKDDLYLTERVVSFLNKIPTIEKIFLSKKNSSSKIISIDLFDSDLTDYDLTMISHLENLDIINLEGIRIQKRNSSLSINDISSGEYHLLNSLVGMFANIKYNSLVLIDEPEISLHPNWQMRYITFLKDVFANFSTCHFIISTHSHFLVSDLEGESSSVTALNRDLKTNQLSAKILLGANTFGWSAEDVLFRVFNVKSARNHYFEMAVADLLNLLSKKSKDFNKITRLVEELKAINISENDPLNELISEAEDYIRND
ncbi:ATP-binding protein [Flavihumibacter sp. RY-1]|uniref:ATP-binding protein n=1 Tax=Flavihumibacter fluminis TaxID=2909236 RepID=A0ABS9BDF9_9BACT|nr:AAA family ATPase [Flavihumibacter fluminis]MCF1713325.1 ATP-binding protein [Flavihumibacter fluminis]